MNIFYEELFLEKNSKGGRFSVKDFFSEKKIRMISSGRFLFERKFIELIRTKLAYWPHEKIRCLGNRIIHKQMIWNLCKNRVFLILIGRVLVLWRSVVGRGGGWIKKPCPPPIIPSRKYLHTKIWVYIKENSCGLLDFQGWNKWWIVK